MPPNDETVPPPPFKFTRSLKTVEDTTAFLSSTADMQDDDDSTKNTSMATFNNTSMADDSTNNENDISSGRHRDVHLYFSSKTKKLKNPNLSVNDYSHCAQQQAMDEEEENEPPSLARTPESTKSPDIEHVIVGGEQHVVFFLFAPSFSLQKICAVYRTATTTTTTTSKKTTPAARLCDGLYHGGQPRAGRTQQGHCHGL